MVYAYIPKQRRKRPDGTSKLVDCAAQGCFVEHVSTQLWRYYDFARKAIDTSHSIEFRELQFLESSQFDSVETHISTLAHPIPKPDQPVFDEIVVQAGPPPALQVFTTRNIVVDKNEIEPQTYQEVMRRSDWQSWKESMYRELEALEKANTWMLCPLPPGKKSIPTKWVFPY